MSAELLERARAAVRSAVKQGAAGVRASVYRERESQLEWRDDKLDRLRESTRLGLGLSLFVDGRFSACTTSDLRPAAVDRFIADAIASTRALARDPFRGLPDASRYTDRKADAELKLLDPAIERMTADERRRAARDLVAAARSAPGAGAILSVSTSCGDTLFEGALATSNGMEGTTARSAFTLFAEVTVRDKGNRKPEGWWWAETRHRARLPGLEELGRRATERAVAQIGAAPVKTAEYACIVENMAAGRLTRALYDALEGQAIQQKRSFLAGKLGEGIGSKALHVDEDPHLAEGLGSRAYDGEGMSTRRRALFEEGVLKSFFVDTYYGRKLKLEPTSGTRTNLVYPAGSRDLPALLAELGDGILVQGFNGGNSNTTTGDFSFGIHGQLVEGGKPVRPVSEMNLAGNHLRFWKALEELGSDAFPYSSNRTPSLRFAKVQFSGV
jgi:PmbA protein